MTQDPAALYIFKLFLRLVEQPSSHSLGHMLINTSVVAPLFPSWLGQPSIDHGRKGNLS